MNTKLKINSDKNIPRLLGAAFLFVFVTGLSDLLRTRVIGSGSISDILINISDNLTLMRISIMGILVSSIGIIVLAVLLYVVLHKQNKTIALVALGLWLAEAITLAISKIGAYALIPLSMEFVEAGAPEHSHFQTLGNFLNYGFDRVGYDIHMLFYCLGGILWFYLFYRSRYIPRGLAVWALTGASLGLIGIVLWMFDLSGNILYFLFFVQIAVYEIIIGLWLVIKGIKDGSETK